VFIPAKARYPSGKGEVCKTFMRRFDPDPRLHSPGRQFNRGQLALPFSSFSFVLDSAPWPNSGSRADKKRTRNFRLAIGQPGSLADAARGLRRTPDGRSLRFAHSHGEGDRARFTVSSPGSGTSLMSRSPARAGPRRSALHFSCDPRSDGHTSGQCVSSRDPGSPPRSRGQSLPARHEWQTCA
jgi:hypothetical protein